ncbi:MAG: hypothetical protein H0V44_01745 [Planctomycetes bacterium]|nr:hypothetical protein [Planctomycetota bacterium]
MRIIFAVLAMLALTTVASSAATPVDPASPEAAVLLPVQVLRKNDFKAFFASLPAEDQAKAQAQWKEAQVNPKAKDTKQFNDTMTMLLAPDAVDQLMAQAEPKLQEMDPQQMSQGLMMISGLLPMLIQQSQMQNQKAGAKPMDADMQKSIAMIQSLMNDASQWVLTSGINDPNKLRTAIEHVVAGAKALKVADAAEMQALQLTEFLDRLGPMVQEVKQALAVYDLQVDPFLDSFTAKSAGEGDKRVLTVGFTAFGNPYEMPVKVENKGGTWSVSPENNSGLNDLQKMMGGGAGGDGGFAPPAEPGNDVK